MSGRFEQPWRSPESWISRECRRDLRVAWPEDPSRVRSDVLWRTHVRPKANSPVMSQRVPRRDGSAPGLSCRAEDEPPGDEEFMFAERGTRPRLDFTA
jgi:hypothetical protein